MPARPLRGRRRRAVQLLQPLHGLRRAVARLNEEWGRLDIVFANAGVNGVWAPIEELAPDELTVEKADGQALIGSGGETPIRLALTAAGFLATPKGLRLRA